MQLSERSKARVQLEANFLTSMAANVAAIGSLIPLGFYFFGDPVHVDLTGVIAASFVCFVMALVLHLIGVIWLTSLDVE